MRRLITLASASAALLLAPLLPLHGAAASDIEPSPTQHAAVHTITKSLTAHWPTTPIPASPQSLHLTLPAELAAFQIDSFAWNLGLGEGSTGTAPGNATSIDIPLPPDLPPHQGLSVVISVPDQETGEPDLSRDSALLWASFTTGDSSGSPAQDAFDYDLSLQNAVASDLRDSSTGSPSPAVLRPGSDFVLDAEDGFWTAPSGLNEPDREIVPQVRLDGNADDRTIDLEYTRSDDGSELFVAIPAGLVDDDVADMSLWVAFYQPRDRSDPQGRMGRFELRMPVRLEHPITTERLGGEDRYDVAVNVSKASYPDGARVAYVVTGSGFADALTAGPAAVKEGGPLLLTTGDSLLPEVSAELARLAPQRIVMVGGPAALTPDVQEELEGIAPTERIDGSDRYAVSRNVLTHAFPDGPSQVFIATGRDFPDALSAGAAAGVSRLPVLLVDGAAPTLDAPTAELLRALSLYRATVVGGPIAVSSEIEAELASFTRANRLFGADRYETSVAINVAVFPHESQAFFATGTTFPDALSGSAWAAKSAMPLYAVRPDCVPDSVLGSLQRTGVGVATLLGGTAALSQAVAELTPCGPSD
jgi:putative cell wall-binding protein